MRPKVQHTPVASPVLAERELGRVEVRHDPKTASEGDLSFVGSEGCSESAPPQAAVVRGVNGAGRGTGQVGFASDESVTGVLEVETPHRAYRRPCPSPLAAAVDAER